MSRAAARVEHDDDDIDLTRARVVGRGPQMHRTPRLSLRGLRTGVRKTQVDLSESTGVAQGDISKLEHRTSLDELQVATIRRFIEGLGGTLELVAVFPKGHRIAIAPAEEE